MSAAQNGSGGMTGNAVERTCDQCAEKGPCSLIEDCYICEKCVASHETAIEAAVDAAMKAFPFSPPLARQDYRDVVGLGVKTYCEYTPDESHRGRSQPQRSGVGGSESQVAPGLLADEERSAPPTSAADLRWLVPPEHRPSCPLNNEPCTSWTCLVDVCDRTDSGRTTP